MRTPASGTPAAASAARTTRAPAAVEPRRRRGRAELLEHHLGDEVVALAVHAAGRSSTSGSREVEGDRERVGRSTARARPAARRRSRAARAPPCRRGRPPRPSRSRPELRRRRPRAPTAASTRSRGRTASSRARRAARRSACRRRTRDPRCAGCPVAANLRASRSRSARSSVGSPKPDEPEVAVPDAARARRRADDLGPEADSAGRARAAPRTRPASFSADAGRSERAGVRRVDASARRGDRRRSPPLRRDRCPGARARRRAWLEVARAAARRRRGSAGDGRGDERRDEGGSSRCRLTSELCSGRRRRRRRLAIDRDRDGAAAPLARLRRAREPEVDDAPLDRVADVGREPWPVARDVQLRAQRDQLRIDGDDALAHRYAERGLAREVVRDRVDLQPVRRGSCGWPKAEPPTPTTIPTRTADERGSPPARSPTHEAGTLTQSSSRDRPDNSPLCRYFGSVVRLQASVDAARVSDL